MKKHNPVLTPNARELRNNMTKQEKHLWYDFLRRHPVKFLRQKVINNFIVDFYCAKAKLVIELDGSQHFTEEGKIYDKERTDILEAYGLNVLRFKNSDIEQNFKNVCEIINKKIKEVGV